MAQALKKTALYPVHAARKARFGSFGGWELPLFYTSIHDEHQAVRSRVGLFDVSHLGHLEVSGQNAGSQLQPLVTQDLLKLEPGRACYTPMLTEQGTILDEMIVYHLQPQRFRWVVNASNGDKVLAWFEKHLSPEITVRDLRDQFGTLALQGPNAVELLKRASKDSFTALARYRVAAGTVAGKSAWVARTGYTGEDGFELFLKVEDLEPVWNQLLEMGSSFGIQPIGLAARDTLRLEAGLPLGGSDLDEKSTPLEARLEWTIAWDKGPFIGREALEHQRQVGLTRRLVGFVAKDSGIPRAGYPISRDGKRIGRVTSGTLLPQKQAVGMGYVEPSSAATGTGISIEVHGRAVRAEIVKLPFYRRRK